MSNNLSKEFFERCIRCKGNGLIENDIELCKGCDGKKCFQCKGSGFKKGRYIECYHCAGSGIILKKCTPESIEQLKIITGLK